MTHEVAQDVLIKHFDRMVKMLKLEHWDIDVKFDRCSDPTRKGECTRHTSYFEAQIVIDPINHKTIEDFLTTLLHELLHLVLAPFDNFYDFASTCDVPENQLKSVWHFACEQSLTNVMRVLHGLGKVGEE